MSNDMMQSAFDTVGEHLGDRNSVRKRALKAKEEDITSLQPTIRSQAEEEERRALEGLAEKAYDSALRVSGDPALAMKVAADFSDIIASVFARPSGGSDNFVNLRSPGQKPAKINAMPGNAGDYGRLARPHETSATAPNRTNSPGGDFGRPGDFGTIPDQGEGTSEIDQAGRPVGSKGEYEQTDAQTFTNPIGRRVPPASLDTRHTEPLATYERPTTVLTGRGFQPRPIPGMKSQDDLSIIKIGRALEVDQYLGIQKDEAEDWQTESRKRSYGDALSRLTNRDSPRDESLDDSQTVNSIATKLGREEGVLSQTLRPEERSTMNESQKLDDEAEFLERESRREEMVGDLGIAKNYKEKAKSLRARAMAARANIGTHISGY